MCDFEGGLIAVVQTTKLSSFSIRLETKATSAFRSKGKSSEIMIDSTHLMTMMLVH